MSEPIKLKAAGDKHTMDVASCAELPFGKYKEYEFVGRDGSVVRVPKAATERQFMRVGLTDKSVVGRRVTLKRDESGDPAKPYWGIYLEDGGTGGPSNDGAAGGPTSGRGAVAAGEGSGPKSPPATAHAPQNGEKMPGASGYKLYRQITEKVLADIVPLYVGSGIQPDATAVHSIVATLFIAANNGKH